MRTLTQADLKIQCMGVCEQYTIEPFEVSDPKFETKPKY